MSFRGIFVPLLLVATLGLSRLGHAADETENAPAAADAAGSASHGAPQSHGPASPTATDPLAIDPDLALVSLIVFGLLLAVLTKFAWGPIAHALEARERSIEENIAAAERSNAEAKSLLADYERRLTQAHEEVRGLLEEARRDAEHTRQSIVTEARAEAEAERDRALRDIELATDRSLKELAEHSATLAVDLAGKIVGARLSPDDHVKLISEAVSEFERARPNGHGGVHTR